MERSMEKIEDVLKKDSFNKEDVIRLLRLDQEESKLLYLRSKEIKEKYVGNKVYLRGLIEFSNICAKDCLYCGIRKSNDTYDRYNLQNEDILEAVKFANEAKYGSVVLQSGELESPAFTERVETLVQQISDAFDPKLGITLSCGEQSEDTYRRWKNAGADRYLLRIETSNEELYYRIHPRDPKHSFQNRLAALQRLKDLGYQTGTGIMVGLPTQTIEDIADDILFMQKYDMDMCGIGPYIESENTPLAKEFENPMSLDDRFHLALKTISIIRIMMKDVNIAASTALQSIDKVGREKAINVAANIFMPNITPTENRKEYLLYDNKPCIDESASECQSCVIGRIALTGNEVAYDELGTSKHYERRMAKK